MGPKERASVFAEGTTSVGWVGATVVSEPQEAAIIIVLSSRNSQIAES